VTWLRLAILRRHDVHRRARRPNESGRPQRRRSAGPCGKDGEGRVIWHEQGGSVATGRCAPTAGSPDGRQEAGRQKTGGRQNGTAVSTPTAGRTGAAGTPIAMQGNERGYGSRVGQGRGGRPGQRLAGREQSSEIEVSSEASPSSVAGWYGARPASPGRPARPGRPPRPGRPAKPTRSASPPGSARAATEPWSSEGGQRGTCSHDSESGQSGNGADGTRGGHGAQEDLGTQGGYGAYKDGAEGDHRPYDDGVQPVGDWLRYSPHGSNRTGPRGCSNSIGSR